MKIGDAVRVKRTKRQGKIVDVQKSSKDRNIYILEFAIDDAEGFFEEELEEIN